MRPARKLAASTAAIGAVFAITAPSASALEVVIEPTGLHCSAVAAASHGPGSGGCLLRAVSAGQVEIGTPFAMVLCNNTFEARVGETGAGYIYSQALTNCSPIALAPCNEPGLGNDTWPITATAENQMSVTFCLNIPIFGSFSCTLNGLTITEAPAHRFTIRTNNGSSHQACTDPFYSVQGTWSQVVDAAHPTVEVLD